MDTLVILESTRGSLHRLSKEAIVGAKEFGGTVSVLAIGKDADLVLWNGHPMSVYSKAEKTIIEGKTYFDLALDQQKRIAIQQERNTLMTMMLNEKENGGKTKPPVKKTNKNFHCDTEF